MIPALISAGASLLGGILGQGAERRAIAAQNAYNDPAQIRARAEAAGFNPLAFIGPGVGQQNVTGGTNYMGAAIADAGLALSADLTRKNELARIEALSAENAALAQQVQRSLLTPQVGGVYTRQQLVPTLGGALGGSNGGAADASATVALKPLDPSVLGTVPVPDPRIDRGAGLFGWGYHLEAAPGWSTGQQFEDEYGETPLSWPYSALKMSADFGHNLGRALDRGYAGYHSYADPLFKSGIDWASNKWFAPSSSPSGYVYRNPRGY